MTTTITCPTCHQQHALFWDVQKGGKKTLSYLCDRQKRFEVETKYGGKDVERSFTGKLSCPEHLKPLDLSSIPEVWSRTYSEDIHNKQQGQLSMMIKAKE